MGNSTGKLTKLRRTQELFERGEIVVIDGEDGEQITYWVMKPNSFHKDEAMKDGRFGRALRSQAFDRDPREREAVDAVIAGMSDEELIEALVSAKGSEHLQLSYDEVRADPEWEERLDLIERASLVGDRPPTAAEDEALAQVLAEHVKAVQDVFSRRVREHRDELAGETRDALMKAFRSNWREMVSVNAFYENRRQTEIFYALRDCRAEMLDGEWRHGACRLDGSHERQILAERDEVLTQLPDELLHKVGEALDRQMSTAEAGNSGAPTASSAS